LYHQNNQHEQALMLTKKLYRKTKNVKYLAQLAMLEYETAKNKNKILNTVIANFNIVLKTIDEPAYNNYFGYLLIDHNINVKRGINLIKKALDKEPLNIAYLDSLAWGYYKLKSCKKAKKIMRDIKKLIVIDDKELKKHYKKIMECK
jgi:predicted Zn-dependent protease